MCRENFNSLLPVFTVFSSGGISSFWITSKWYFSWELAQVCKILLLIRNIVQIHTFPRSQVLFVYAEVLFGWFIPPKNSEEPVKAEPLSNWLIYVKVPVTFLVDESTQLHHLPYVISSPAPGESREHLMIIPSSLPLWRVDKAQRVYALVWKTLHSYGNKALCMYCSHKNVKGERTTNQKLLYGFFLRAWAIHLGISILEFRTWAQLLVFSGLGVYDLLHQLPWNIEISWCCMPKIWLLHHCSGLKAW